MSQHDVCWTVRTGSSVVTIDAKPALDFMPTVRGPATFEFRQGASCPSSEAGNFTMTIAPKEKSSTGPVSNDIVDIQSSTATSATPGRLTFTDKYTTKDLDIFLGMRLKSTRGSIGEIGIDSGQPIIRNKPSHFAAYLLGMLALAVAAYMVYRWWRERPEASP